MYPNIKNWYDYYAISSTDQRAVEDFIECETAEVVRGFQSELIGITNGDCNEQALQGLMGKQRFERFGCWEEWAKMMLLWLANYRR